MAKWLGVVALLGLLISGGFGCSVFKAAARSAGVPGGVVDAGAGEVSGAARKVATPTRIDNYEPNDTLLEPTVIKINTTTKATIDPAGDVDVFKVHVASNKREVVQVSFLNPTLNLRPHLVFYNQNREEIGDIRSERGAQAKGQFIAEPNKDYYVRVYSGWGGPDDARSGKYYSLEVKLASVSDKYEPNDSLTEPAKISLGEVKATINPAGDVDCFKVQITEAGKVKVTLSNPTLNLRPHLVFYNQNREEISDVRSDKGAAQATGEFTAEAGKHYFIKVYSGWGGPDEETSTKFYTLKIEMAK